MNYVHCVPGRLRLKFPQLKNEKQKAFALERALRRIEGISLVQANSHTGSLLIHYTEGKVDEQELFTTIQEILAAAGIATTIRDLGSLRTMTAPSRDSALVDKAVEHLVEKCVERAALMLLGAIL